MKKKIIAMLLVGCLGSALLAGCNGNSNAGKSDAENSEQSVSEENPPESEQTGGEYTVTYLSPSTASEYWQYAEIGMQNAAQDMEKEHGIKVNFSTTGPAEESQTDSYITAFESTIATKPDAIITATLIPDATVEKSREAMDAGIYVNYVSMGLEDGDSNEYDDCYGVHYYCDNTTIGETAAQCMLDAWEEAGIEPKGYVGLHMSVVVESLEKRMQGFVDYMAEHAPDVKCIDTLYNENDVNNGQSNVETQISTYGDELIGLYGGNNVSGDGIALALQNAGDKKIVGIAVDSDSVEIEGLKGGYFYAIVAQTPYEQGYNAMVNAITYLMTGENTETEKHINCVSTAVTADMMDEEEYASLLDPTLLKR